jgi:hypothetical protein
MNDLRVLDGDEVLYESTISTGSARDARKVSKTVAALYALGGRVEVRTSKGWEPRRVIQTSRWRYYTRTAGGAR